MEKIEDLMAKIKNLKQARDILYEEYSKTDFHKRKEAHPHESIPPSPQDEEVYKLLIAIQQIEAYIKKLQDEQFQMIKGEN